jgi:signal transduction histidine kinase
VAASSDTDPHGLSWPLVERRRTLGFPPFGIERRRAFDNDTSPARTLRPAPLAPFRLAALAVATIGTIRDLNRQRWYELVLLGVMAAITALAVWRPAPHANTPEVRSRILAEEAAAALAVVLTRTWSSPFILFLVPTGMLAGFAVGAAYSMLLGFGASIFIGAPHIALEGWARGTRDAALWAGLLLLVGYTSGVVRQSVLDSQRVRSSNDGRLAELMEANSLLASLQRFSHLTPTSLDPDEIIDTTIQRLEGLIPFDHLSLLLIDSQTMHANVVRSRGRRPADLVQLTDLPSPLRLAHSSQRPILLRSMVVQAGVVARVRCGVYTTLRARGHDVGFLAVESDTEGAFNEQHVEVLHGVAQTLAVAIDNAHLFQGISTIAADQERTRLARNLHDQLGSSLALVGFELDRALGIARQGGDVEGALALAREQVTSVVADMRETLYDLRTEVNDRQDLAETVRSFLARVGQRSSLDVRSHVHLSPRLTPIVERELWQIVREAVLNAERHAKATELSVSIDRKGSTVVALIRDNGIGLVATAGRADSYGLSGMRERATRLRASLSVGIPSDGGQGTEVRFEWSDPSPVGEGVQS